MRSFYRVFGLLFKSVVQHAIGNDNFSIEVVGDFSSRLHEYVCFVLSLTGAHPFSSHTHLPLYLSDPFFIIMIHICG